MSVATPGSAQRSALGAPHRPAPAGLAALLTDALTSMRRVLLHYRHSPGLVAASLAVPVVMVVLFGYVFGSAMRVPGGDYREFLLPGLFAMVSVNGITPTMVGAARDVARGAADRIRSMPVSRFGVLLGTALADLLVSTVVLVLLAAVGLLSGWRAHRGPGLALAGFGLLLLFRFVMTWLGTCLGLAAGREEVAGQLAVLTFPVAMVTNSFVPTGGMPGWLRVVAEWNPISSVVAAARQLFGNPAGSAAGWPLHHPVTASLLWAALLLALCGPLAVRGYHRHGR
ncbi:ABC transporter permease [Kitasatospora sp. NBC_01287]|uniref:ABC transporter permease n=1 Tax=Kitasatospora sp. NBC_01287 TaxID=2903573 RepID=UPI00224CE07B|nr:ABC transporter permease [Kitasatospora sp. NBC_01287]MCX4745065.1 ABC transporter permease [Kitasatospora sp. NBC_01287]